MGPDEELQEQEITNRVYIPHDFTVRDTDGDLTWDINSIMASRVIGTIENATSVQIGGLNLSDPESFYDFLKMWPLYNQDGQVIGLFDTKEHRDQAAEKIRKRNSHVNPVSSSPLKKIFSTCKKSTS